MRADNARWRVWQLVGSLVREKYGDDYEGSILDVGCRSGMGRNFLPPTQNWIGIQQGGSLRRDVPNIHTSNFLAGGHLPMAEVVVAIGLDKYGPDAPKVVQRVAGATLDYGTAFVEYQGEDPKVALRWMQAEFSSVETYKRDGPVLKFWVYVGTKPRRAEWAE